MLLLEPQLLLPTFGQSPFCFLFLRLHVLHKKHFVSQTSNLVQVCMKLASLKAFEDLLTPAEFDYFSIALLLDCTVFDLFKPFHEKSDPFVIEWICGRDGLVICSWRDWTMRNLATEKCRAICSICGIFLLLFLCCEKLQIGTFFGGYFDIFFLILLLFLAFFLVTWK